MPNDQMEIKDPGETLGRGSGPGMRAGRHTDTEKDPKKYMGFNFPESFIRDLKLAATFRDMTVTQFVLETLRPDVDEALDELTELMEDRQSASRRT